MNDIGRTLRRWAVGAALLTLLACKPSIEGETRAWDQNKLTLQEWVGKFPNFRAAVDGRLAEAQAEFDAAKGLGDADQRADKMREANNKLAVLTTAFQEIDRKIKEYDTLKRDPTLATLPGQVLMPAMQMSDALLREARAKMDGPVGNAGEALGRLRDASSAIDRAMTPLRDARSRAAQRPNPPGQPGQPGQAPGQPPAMGQVQPPSGQPMAPQGVVPGTTGPNMRPMGGPSMGPGMGPGAGLGPAVAPPPGQPMVQGVGGPPPGVMPAGAPPSGGPAAGAPPAVPSAPAAQPGARPF